MVFLALLPFYFLSFLSFCLKGCNNLKPLFVSKFLVPMPMKPPFVSLYHIPNKTMTIFIRQFTRKVRVISHKSELCSHFKAYFEGSGTTFAIIDILPTIVAFTCCCIFLVFNLCFHPALEVSATFPGRASVRRVILRPKIEGILQSRDE